MTYLFHYIDVPLSLILLLLRDGVVQAHAYSYFYHYCIEVSGDGASVFSGDYFMSTQTFSPEQVKQLSQQYDLFDMEAYAVAQFCRMYDIPFYCLKAVSDNLDGNLKDWRSILADIRARFTELLNLP